MDKPHDPPRQRPWLRRTAFVVACLCLGVVVTVGVAWAGVVTDDWDEFSTGQSRRRQCDGWVVYINASTCVTQRMGYLATTRESACEVPSWSVFETTTPTDRVIVTELDAGWPWRALRCARTYTLPGYSISDSTPINALSGAANWQDSWWGAGDTTLPVGIIAGGFVSSTLTFAVAWATLLSVLSLIGRIRDHNRTTIGLCRFCRHRLTTDQLRCPECGHLKGDRRPWIMRGSIAVTGLTCVAGAAGLGVFALWFQSNDPMQLIHHAAAAGDAETVRAELTRGVLSDLPIEHERTTPLMIAIREGHLDVARRILDDRPPSEFDLYTAITNNRPEAIDLLLEYNLAIGDPQVQMRAASAIVRADDVDMLWQVSNRGLIPDPPSDIWQVALSRACGMEQRALANAMHDIGIMPSTGALDWGQPFDTTILTMTLYADPCDGEFGDYVPTLFHSCGRGDETHVRLFLRFGFSAVQPADDGTTPLHVAVSSYDAVSICQLLLDHGADPNARSLRTGHSPLHEAVFQTEDPNAELIRLLLEFGADPYLENNDGETPLDLLYQPGINAKRLFGEYLRDQ